MNTAVLKIIDFIFKITGQQSPLITAGYYLNVKQTKLLLQTRLGNIRNQYTIILYTTYVS